MYYLSGTQQSHGVGGYRIREHGHKTSPSAQNFPLAQAGLEPCPSKVFLKPAPSGSLEMQNLKFHHRFSELKSAFQRDCCDFIKLTFVNGAWGRRVLSHSYPRQQWCEIEFIGYSPVRQARGTQLPEGV